MAELAALAAPTNVNATLPFHQETKLELIQPILNDAFDQVRRDGISLDDATQKAGEIPFLPIVLTTLTAIGGLLPLALQAIGAVLPAGIGSIGGLVSGILIARLVTPVLYKMLAPALEDAVLTDHWLHADFVVSFAAVRRPRHSSPYRCLLCA